MSKKTKSSNTSKTGNASIPDVMLSVYEKLDTEKLKEHRRVLAAEIAAMEDSLRTVENEIFYRENPECRPH